MTHRKSIEDWSAKPFNLIEPGKVYPKAKKREDIHDFHPQRLPNQGIPTIHSSHCRICKVYLNFIGFNRFKVKA